MPRKLGVGRRAIVPAEDILQRQIGRSRKAHRLDDFEDVRHSRGQAGCARQAVASAWRQQADARLNQGKAHAKVAARAHAQVGKGEKDAALAVEIRRALWIGRKLADEDLQMRRAVLGVDVELIVSWRGPCRRTKSIVGPCPCGGRSDARHRTKGSVSKLRPQPDRCAWTHVAKASDSSPCSSRTMSCTTKAGTIGSRLSVLIVRPAAGAKRPCCRTMSS